MNTKSRTGWLRLLATIVMMGLMAGMLTVLPSASAKDQNGVSGYITDDSCEGCKPTGKKGDVDFTYHAPLLDEDGNIIYKDSGSDALDAGMPYRDKTKPVEGAQVMLFKIADWQGGPHFKPVAPYDERKWFPVKESDTPYKVGITQEYEQDGLVHRDNKKLINWDLTKLTLSQQRDMAYTFYLYIRHYMTMKVAHPNDNSIPDIQANYETRTDANGVAKFRGVEEGLYVAMSPVEEGNNPYYAAQFLSMPSVHVGDAGKYDRTGEESVALKTSYENDDDPIHARKVWDDGDASDRPKSVWVSLYMDGVKYSESVELNEANNWSYVWDNLPERRDYYVLEDNVPEGYAVSYSLDRIDYISSYVTITNSKPHDNSVPPTVPTQTTTKPSVSTPARTGADIAVVAIMAAAAVGIAVVLILEVRKARARENK